MWSIWPELPAYGRKAAQFVDLLGYFSLKTAQTEKKLKEYSQKAVEILRANGEEASIIGEVAEGNGVEIC